MLTCEEFERLTADFMEFMDCKRSQGITPSDVWLAACAALQADYSCNMTAECTNQMDKLSR